MWEKGELNGKGSAEFPHGEKYTGGFKNGVPHGKADGKGKTATATRDSSRRISFAREPIIMPMETKPTASGSMASRKERESSGFSTG